MPDAPPVLTNDARYRINPCPVPTMRRWIESTLPPVPTMPGCMMRRIASKFAPYGPIVDALIYRVGLGKFRL